MVTYRRLPSGWPTTQSGAGRGDRRFLSGELLHPTVVVGFPARSRLARCESRSGGKSPVKRRHCGSPVGWELPTGSLEVAKLFAGRMLQGMCLGLWPKGRRPRCAASIPSEGESYGSSGILLLERACGTGAKARPCDLLAELAQFGQSSGLLIHRSQVQILCSASAMVQKRKTNAATEVKMCNSGLLRENSDSKRPAS